MHNTHFTFSPESAFLVVPRKTLEFYDLATCEKTDFEGPSLEWWHALPPVRRPLCVPLHSLPMASCWRSLVVRHLPRRANRIMHVLWLGFTIIQLLAALLTTKP